MNQPVKVLTVVGARPQFIKAAMVSRAISRHNADSASPSVVEEIIHTGQHYDPEMSGLFFEEMGIPEPARNLHVGSGHHGATTGVMLEGIEAEVLARRPDWLLVYGDTNSTLAGALVGAKLHVPVVHVEAGLRSFNRAMPEEINRVVADHVSTLLLCPTGVSITNLAAEGITSGVVHVGDVMYDAAQVFGELAEARCDIIDRLGLAPGGYYLVTAHRAENTDDPARMKAILRALGEISSSHPVLFPVHPRTRKIIDDHGLADLLASVHTIAPVSFMEMILLERHATAILTDSGGIQKEAYFHGVPCLTLRDETEWVETVDAGWNQLVGADTAAILAGVARATTGTRPIPDFGDGRAAEMVVRALLDHTAGETP